MGPTKNADRKNLRDCASNSFFRDARRTDGLSPLQIFNEAPKKYPVGQVVRASFFSTDLWNISNFQIEVWMYIENPLFGGFTRGTINTSALYFSGSH